MTEEHFNALPTGYQLYEYTIKSVLGHGGFGITYLAYDENLNKDVAIKEYLPAEFAVRQGAETVRPRSSADADDYEWGLERFMKEAQTLALFRHPSIVPVFRFFKANGTAYMVMEYQEGESLAALMRKHRGEFTEEDLLQLVEPILNGLAEVHKAGYLHRDVKPGNIYIRQDGTPVLLDFGAARAAVGRKSQSLTSIVTPGYAPLEQYFADGNQGPWTDIYALAAILYQAVAGRIPPEAPARVKNDPISSAREMGKGKFSPLFLAAVDRALMVEEEDRPQTTTEWRDMLIGRTPAFPNEGVAAPAPAPDPGATMIAGAASAASQAAATQSAPTGLAPAGREPGPFDDRQPVTGPPPRQRSGSAVRVAVIAGAVLFLMTVAAAAGYFVLKESGGLDGILASDDKNTNGKNIATDDPETARRKAEEAKRKAAEAERQKQEAEAKRKAEEEARRKAEAEAKRTQDAEARRKAEEEARKRAEAERLKREQETKRQAELERQRKAEEEKRKAEEERLKREAQEREEARRKREEEARRRAEEERKRREEEERKRTQTANLTDGVSCPSSLPALNGNYSHATDCFFVRRVFISALSTGIKGSTSRWSNSRSGASGTLTVLKAVQKSDGTFCRQFQQTLTVKGVTKRGVGMACFLGNQWKITS